MKEKGPSNSVNVASWQGFSVETGSRTQVKDITTDVAGLVRQAGIDTGVCHLYVPHTTAGILVNESDDPDVARDIGEALDRLVPRNADYKHFEGNADSHIKASLLLWLALQRWFRLKPASLLWVAGKAFFSANSTVLVVGQSRSGSSATDTSRTWIPMGCFMRAKSADIPPSSDE
jgi:thiamine phosphate synthase YjbQ (UPF0047 family)